MTGSEIQAGLQDIEGGGRLESIRYTSGASVVEFTLQEGIVPDSSNLSAEDVSAYVASRSGGETLATVAVHHDEGADEAVVGIDTDSTNRVFVQRLVTRVLERSGATVGVLDPTEVTAPTEVLTAAGFTPKPEDPNLYRIAA